MQKNLKDMVKKMEKEMEPQLVRLGDASIASPFTSRHTSIACSKLRVGVAGGREGMTGGWV